MKKIVILLFFLPLSLPAQIKNALEIWFNKPAEIWEECLPLGNGTIGAMPDGGIVSEKIILNDISLWSGGVQDPDNPEAANYLPKIRELLLAGKNDEAQDLVYKTFVCKGAGSGYGQGSDVPYGSFETLGELQLKHHKDTVVKDYRRSLWLNEALMTCTYTLKGIKYKREYFTDYKNNVLVIRIEANKKKSIDLDLGLSRPRAAKVSVENEVLKLEGQLNNGTDGKGMRFGAALKVNKKGGRMSTTDSSLLVRGADEVILFLSMGTDYHGKLNFEKNLNTVIKSNYQDLKKEHERIYKMYFERVQLNLEGQNRENLPINERLVAFAKDPNDNALCELYFQFGRYLLISSTNPAGLPPNLQGLWANTIHTPWNGDYHLNINVQMNHWPAEVTNLAELHRPLINLTKSLVVPGTKSAKAFYNANGWVAHMMTNVWGYTAPGEHPSWGATNTGGGWLCQHLWEHYLFNPDKKYLEEIYPVLKEASHFFLDMLIKDPTTDYLVTAPSTSPENAFYMPGTKKAVSICMGPTMDNQIVRELFSNTITAAEILQTDNEFVNKLKQSRQQLPPEKIGKYGQLMEWLEDYEEAEPQHRHVSHLYGLHPGNQITVENTPSLAQAARVTLDRRGDGGTGWSRAWKINFRARLKEGDRAYGILVNLLNPTKIQGVEMSNKGGSYPNLFCAHPPFQIDGNFGGCAGIAEMLIQSHAGFIEFLPALPSIWSSGSFSGLKVRGGAEVALKWKEGKLENARLTATTDNNFKIKLPCDMQLHNAEKITKHRSGEIIEVELKKGEICTLTR